MSDPLSDHLFLTCAIALVVVRSRDNRRFLLVEEGAGGDPRWVVPGGKVEGCDRETFEEAAVREVFEETGGLVVNLEGVLTVQFNPAPLPHVPGFARLRVIFVASPANGNGPQPKTPAKAAWFSRKQLEKLSLDPEPERLLAYVASQSAQVYPLGLFSDERAWP